MGAQALIHVQRGFFDLLPLYSKCYKYAPGHSDHFGSVTLQKLKKSIKVIKNTLKWIEKVLANKKEKGKKIEKKTDMSAGDRTHDLPINIVLHALPSELQQQTYTWEVKS